MCKTASLLYLVPHRWRLDITVTDRLEIVSLHSSCGVADEHTEMLLVSHGYRYLYWATLCYLTESSMPHDISTLRPSVRDTPIMCFEIAPSLKLRPSGSREASASPILRVAPFSTRPTHQMVAVGTSDATERWFGRPVLLFVMTTHEGKRHELVYIQWLAPPLTGVLRKSSSI